MRTLRECVAAFLVIAAWAGVAAFADADLRARESVSQSAA